MTARTSGLARLLLVVAVALGFTALTTMTAPRADAHDVLVSTAPADGSTVGVPPAEVTLTFDEPAIALGTQLRIEGPNGEAQQGSPRLVNNTVNQALRPGSPAGDYTVTWRVTSVDGHPVSGTFSFTATRAGASTTAPASAPSGSTPPPATDRASATTPGAAGSITASATAGAPSAGDGAGGSALPWVLGIGAAVLVLGVGAAIWSAGRRE